MSSRTTEPNAGTSIGTEGGAYVGSNVSTSGDFIGRDKVIIVAEQTYSVYGLPNPYLGLRAYTYDDQLIYAGREQSAQEALEKLTKPGAIQTCLFITGASGIGKSSFVQAALLPKLETHYQRRGKVVRYAIFRPSSQPRLMLEDALAQLAADIHLANGEIIGTPANQVNLLVVDQFEEVFIQSEATQREELFQFLATLAPFVELRTHIIATLRADYLNDLFAFKSLWNIAKDGVELRAMSTDELRNAIQKPLQVLYPQKYFAPELLEHLIKDASSEPTLLPLLQVTLAELWKKGNLTLRHYESLTDAIRQQVEIVYTYIDHASANPYQKRTLEDCDNILNIFLELVNVSLDDNDHRDVRQRRARVDLEKHLSERKGLIEELINARLLSTSIEMLANQQVEMVDIIHETLISNWDRFRQAIADKRQQLQQRMHFELQLKLWLSNNCDDDYLLLTSIQLAEARALYERYDIAMRNTEGQDFYRRSIAHQEAEQQRQLAEAQAQAKREHQRAEELAQTNARAERLARLARASELAVRAQFEQAGVNPDPSLVLLLAIEAVELTRQPYGIFLPSAAAALDNAIRNGPYWYLRRCIHVKGVRSAMFNPNGDLLAVVASDHIVRLFDTTKGQEVLQLNGHTDKVLSAVFDPTGKWVVTAGYDKTVRLWDVASGQELLQIRAHKAHVRFATFNFNSTRLVTASADRTARLWDVTSGRELLQLRGHTNKIISAEFSPDGTRLVTASTDGTARLWDTTTGQELLQLCGHGNIVRTAVFSPDGRHIVTASDDRTVRLWDASTGKELLQLQGHRLEVSSAMYSSDGKLLVTASRDRTIRLWDSTTGQELLQLGNHKQATYSAAFSLDSRSLATTSTDGTISLWNIENEQRLLQLRGHMAWIRMATFSPNGTRVVTASADNTARLWDAVTGQELMQYRGHRSRVLSAVISPDGTRLVTAGVDCTARLWDVNTGQELFQLIGHENVTRSATFSADGRRVVTASTDGTARIWDAATGQELLQLNSHTTGVLCAAFSPNGSHVATAGYDPKIQLWEMTTGQELMRLYGHTASIRSVAYDPGGTHLVTASYDKTARVWDATTGQELLQLRGHTDKVFSAIFNLDGTRLVTASVDKTARVWDATTGQELLQLRGHTDAVLFAAFSPDSSRVVTASSDGTARIWASSIEHLLEIAKLLIHREPPEFTAEERQQLWLEQEDQEVILTRFSG